MTVKRIDKFDIEFLENFKSKFKDGISYNGKYIKLLIDGLIQRIEGGKKNRMKNILLGNMQFRDEDNRFTTRYENAVDLVISKSMFEEIMKSEKEL